MIDNIVLGLGLQFYSLNQLQDIFQVNAFVATSQGGVTQIPVVPCTKDMWS
jgi:hypothetical protein